MLDPLVTEIECLHSFKKLFDTANRKPEQRETYAMQRALGT